MKFYTSREAAKTLGLHPNTLRRWANDGKIKFIKTASGQRRYDVDNYLGVSKLSTVCYCRVSNNKQRDDLEKQVTFMRQHYPDAKIVKDIGSGLNFKRKGLNAILERAMRGDCIKLVVTHQDRLARFGTALVRFVIEKNGGELLVLSEHSLSPKQEFTRDLLNIIHIFSCKIPELRKYEKQIHQIISDSNSTKNL